MRPSVLAGIIGSGPVVLPAGAVGAWYADQYDATANAVPNSLDSRPLSASKLRFPRRRFAGLPASSPFTQNGCTVVDNVATSPDGRTEASTVTSTNAASLGLYYDIGTSLPSGTYSMCLSYRQNGGSLNTFKMKVHNNAQVSPTYTATSTWQRAVFTFTATASFGIVQIVTSIDGTTGYDIQICDFQLFAGSSDLNTTWATQSPLDTHIYFGRSVLDSNVTVSSGGFEVNGGNDYGFIQFPDSVTLTNFALVTCFARQSTGGSGGFGVFSTVGNGNVVVEVQISDQQPGFDVGGVTAVFPRALGAMVPKDSTYRLWGSRMKGDGTADVWADDSAFYFQNSPTYSPTSQSVKDMYVGCTSSPASGTSGYKFNSMVLYPSSAVPNTAGMRTAFTVLRTRAALSSISPSRASRYLLANGDSITAETFSYVVKFLANASPAVLGARQAVSGYGLANWIGQQSYLADVIPASKSGRVYIYTLLPGANDSLNYTTPAAMTAAVAAHIDYLRAAGWDKIVLATTLPRAGDATFNTWRNACNVIYRTWLGGRVDALADFAADATMGPDNSRATNPSLWLDETHPNSAGHDLLEPIYRAAVNSV